MRAASASQREAFIPREQTDASPLPQTTMHYEHNDYIDISEQMIHEINQGHFDHSAVNENVHISYVN